MTRAEPRKATAFTHERELRLLAKRLAPGETQRALVAGKAGRRQGILVATDRRILFLHVGLIVDHVVGWPYGAIASVDVTVHSPDEASIEVHGDKLLRVDGADKRDAEAFAQVVARVAPERSFRRVRPVDDPREATHSDELLPPAERRLVQLERRRRKGSITESEYQASRARLLEAAGLPRDLPPPDLPPEAPRDLPPWPGTQADPVRRRSGEEPSPRGRGKDEGAAPPRKR